MFVIFDLDGTLADDTHRIHYIMGEKRDWTSYFATAHADTPLMPAIEVMIMLANEGHRVEIWTGRPEWLRKTTVEWLTTHVSPSFDWGGLLHQAIPIRMRPDDDYRSSSVVKGEWLAEERARGLNPDLALDDRRVGVEFWRGHGIACWQVQDREEAHG